MSFSDFIGFEGNLPWISNQIRSLCHEQSISQYNTEIGGVEIWPGIDLGYCGLEIFEEVVRPNLNKRSWKTSFGVQ